MDTVAETPYGSRYQPVQKIARGGMADVYEALDTLLDRSVALKVLFPELSVNEAFVERFRREAQAAGNLSHPNIVSVFDWGRDKGTYYIVMELVSGSTLSKVIRDDAPLAPERVAIIGADVAAALAFAHRHGIIHRDIKPSNVLITEEGDVKVADFGIARAASSEGDLTQTGSVLGTATYISPEQAQGNSLDGRSDIYSLGIVLYEMATGAVPFTGDSPLSIAFKHVKETPIRPRMVNPELPEALEAIILKCLAKLPANRYATASELRADLMRFSQGKAVTAPPFVGEPATELFGAVGGDAVTQLLPVNVPAFEGASRSQRRGLWVAAIIGVVVVLLAAAVFVGGKLNLFAPPTTIVADVNVPVLNGLTYQQAVTQLTSQHLKAVKQVQPSNAAIGIVVNQNPKSNTSIRKGSKVTVYVSAGPTTSPIPGVVNTTISNAENALTTQGFLFSTNYVSSATVANGTVISQAPISGTPEPQGFVVALTVSSGPSQVSVPPVVGEQQAQAGNDLGAAGLKLGNVTMETPPANQAAGIVLQQSIASGTLVSAGTSVDLVVSNGCPSANAGSTTPATTATPPPPGGGPTTTAPATTTTTIPGCG